MKKFFLVAFCGLCAAQTAGATSSLAVHPSSHTATGVYNSDLARAGERIFIEPLVVKDADIDNQITVAPSLSPGYGGSTLFQTPIALEKRLTHSFSLRLESHYEDVQTPGGAHTGFQYFGVQGKYMFYENAPHEIMATAIVRATTPMGYSQAGQGNPMTLYGYLLFNKGMGDIPVSWIRPFAIQTDIAGITPFGSSGPEPLSPYVGLYDFGNSARFDGALEYSFLYLHDVVGWNVPSFLDQVVPAIESRTLINESANGHQGATAGYTSYEINYQTDWYQIGLAYQTPYGVDSSFIGRRGMLYMTFFYGWLLKKMGYNSTPF